MPKLSFAEKTVADHEEEERLKKLKKEEEEEEEEDEDINYDDDEEIDEDEDDEFDEKRLLAELNKEIEEDRKKLNVKKGKTKAKTSTEEEEEEATKAKKVVKPLSKKDLEKYNKEQDQHGIIFISRIPPGMTPQKVKQIMEGFGKIERVYLTPESNERRKLRRKEYGKSGGKRYTNGWVEFCDKRIAKAVAFSLNGTPIGGRNRCIYAQDLWLIKYLPKFKWSDLTEKLSQEKEMRHQRLEVALARAKRQNELVLERMSQARGKEIYEQKKKKRLEKKASIVKTKEKLKKTPGNSKKKTSNPNFRHL